MALWMLAPDWDDEGELMTKLLGGSEDGALAGGGVAINTGEELQWRLQRMGKEERTRSTEGCIYRDNMCRRIIVVKVSLIKPHGHASAEGAG